MMIFQAEMDFDGLREEKVPPPGGVHKEYVEERAVPQATKQGAKYAQPFDYYHNDHLATPQVITDSTGAVAWKASYNAFGNATVDASSTITNNLRFPGQYYDAETGLHYNWNRYYDPNTGRYLTPDPIGLMGGINPFAYVGNDPINKIDPSGNKPWYGNYCGPGNNAGAPIDNLDAACQAHDNCYAEAGLSAKDVINSPKHPKRCNDQAACDAKLCSAATSFPAEGFKQKAARGAIMKIFCK